jgi:ubiquinone/menaquinone biosynthesis C-methylase UbiE
VVLAAYLLNYAQTRTELQAMCDGIARCLKPGGRFVTVNSNPACNFSTAPAYRKYGFETSVAGPWIEGAPVTWRFYLENSVFELENYFLDVAIHEAALSAAGFREIRWHGPQLTADGRATYAPDFWSSFLECPPVTFLECIK